MSLRRQRGRWLLTTFGIAVGIASFTGVLAISRSIMSAFAASVIQIAGRAQLQVSNGTVGVTQDLIADIEKLPGVEAVSGNVQYDVMAPALGRRLTVFGILLGADHRYREAQFGAGALALPDAGTFLVLPDSIAVATDVLEEQQWTTGTTFTVVGAHGSRILTVRGTLDARGPLAVFGGDVAVMDAEAAQAAFGELGRFHWIDVVVADEASVDEVRRALASIVAGRGVVETPYARGERMEAMLATLRWILTASGTVAMLVAIFLIHHTVATAIRRRRVDFATLRAIGATRGMIISAVLGEAAVVGAVGSLLGVALGIAFAAMAARPFGDVVGLMYTHVPPPPVRLTFGELLAALGLGEGTALVASASACALLARRRPPDGRVPRRERLVQPWRLAALGILTLLAGLVSARLCRTAGFATGVAAIGGLAACVFLATTLFVPAFLIVATPPVTFALRRGWGRLGVWLWQQVRRYGAHTVTTIAAMAAAVAFTVGLSTLFTSYRAAVSEWVAQILSADVFINAGATFRLLSAPTMSPALREEVARVPGVARVLPWRYVQIQYRGKPIIVQGLDRGLLERWHPDVSLDPDRVVVSDTLAERYGLAPGNLMEVATPIGPLRVTVDRVRPDYLLDLGNFKLEWSTFVQHFGDDGANMLLVDALPGTPSLGLKRRIEAHLGTGHDVTVLTGDELRQLVSRLIDSSFALTTGLQGLAVLVTIFAMINATSAALLDRQAELATWRAIGLERSRLIRLLTVEACVVGALAGALGVAAGAFIGEQLVHVVAPAVAGFRLPLHWPLGWMAGVIALTSAMAGMTAAAVARRQLPAAVTAMPRGA